jgi:formate dehydrogenase major subunit
MKGVPLIIIDPREIELVPYAKHHLQLRPGVGVNPLRGQNNVQGAADMGCQPHQGAGYLAVNDPEVHRLYEEFYGVHLSDQIGWKIPQMYEAALAGKLKAMWIMGEDVAQTDPNTEHVKAALNALEFLVVQELFMTPTAEFADVVLPASSFLEKSGTFTNGERRVQRVNAVIAPLEGTKPDGVIIAEMMQRMGCDQAAYTPDGVLAEIAEIVPFFKGATWEGLTDQGRQWPIAPGNVGTERLHLGTFKRGLGKFHFFDFKESKEIERHGGEYPFILTTGRLLEHYNCGTMTRRTGNAEIVTGDTLALHPEDAARKGIEDGDEVVVRSARGEIPMLARISGEVKPGVLYCTFHFPEVLVNIVTSSECDEDTMCPEYKVVAVDIAKVGSKAMVGA